MSTVQSSHFFFFNDPATTEIYTLSLHDALPILRGVSSCLCSGRIVSECDKSMTLHRLLPPCRRGHDICYEEDRKSTRLNSSHTVISYAVFCLKKKKKKKKQI